MGPLATQALRVTCPNKRIVAHFDTWQTLQADPKLPIAVKSGDLVAGRYRLSHPIGVGGMGCVWAARHEGIDREVALKIPEGPHSSDPELRQRFLAEARALGRLRHPNIVDVLDSGELDDGRLFIVFELLEGSGLDSYLHEAGRMRASDAVKIAIELCRGLEFAHGAGVIHRDLKPANVYLHQSPGGGMLVKLLDFGISKTFDGGAPVSLTSSGNVVGTPLYMSPEQARGDAVDQRTDLWNVGVVLYEMLAGLAPFEGKGYSATVAKIVSEDPPPLSAWGVYAAPELESVINKCLSRDRDKRYADAAGLRAALEELLPLVRHSTPPRMSISSLVDLLPSLPPPPGSLRISDSAQRAFSTEAPTLAPPPASSMRPVTNSFAPTPAPAHITIPPSPTPPKRPWRAAIAAGAGLLLVALAIALLSTRLSSQPDSPTATNQPVAASPTSAELSPVQVPMAESAAAAPVPAASASADRDATPPRSDEPARPPAVTRREPSQTPPSPAREVTGHTGSTKVNDPGF